MVSGADRSVGFGAAARSCRARGSHRALRVCPNHVMFSITSYPISRVTPVSNVIPFAGLLTMSQTRRSPSTEPRICSVPPILRGWRIVRMHGKSHAGSFRYGDHSLEE